MLEPLRAELASMILPYAEPITYMLWIILLTGLVQNIVTMMQLPAAWFELRHRAQAEDTESPWQLLISTLSLPITILVPAYNEEMVIVENVRSLLSLKYPFFELIIVNDGSKDQTLARLIEAFHLEPVARAHEEKIPHKPIRGLYASSLFPRLLVIDKENGGGKADALNAGINHVRTPLLCAVDADSLLEPEALLRSVRPFMEDQGSMVAVGGTIRVLNGCYVLGGQIKEVGLPRHFLPLIQSLEYIRAFLIARLAWSRWNMLTIVSGAFGIFSRGAVVDVDGFSPKTVGEDYDLIIKMHRHFKQNNKPYAMRYVPEPVCWTEAPETLETLAAQRGRWQQGALEVFFKNSDMFLSPRFGKLGVLALSNNFIIDVLGPLMEVAGYFLVPFFWFAGILDTDFLWAFLAVFFMFGFFISISSLILEEMELRRTSRPRDLFILGLAAIAENFGYRQLNNLWRVQGWWRFIRKRTDWGDMKRTGRAYSLPKTTRP